MELDINDWPNVPQNQQPRKFWTNQNIDDIEKMALQDKGWEVVDVRLMPETTDQERQEVVRAYLWGVTNGTIPNTKALLDVLDLKAKACGLVGNKEASLEKPKMDKSQLDTLLEVGTNRIRELPQVKRRNSKK